MKDLNNLKNDNLNNETFNNNDNFENINAYNLRENIKKSAIEFKKNWISFAKILSEVYKNKLYENWGYNSIYDYSKKELSLKKETVFKLLNSYDFIVYENININEEKFPSLDTISQLAKYKTKILNDLNYSQNKDNIIKKFDDLKNEALEKNLSLNSLRKKGKEIFDENIEEKDEKDEEDEDSQILSKDEKKRAIFHLRRLASIIIKENTPINIINSIKDIEEYIS